MTMLLPPKASDAELTSSPVCNQLKKKRKRVHFQQDSNGEVKKEILGPLLKPCSEMDEEEKRRIYWSKQDYQVFRSARHMLASVIKERDLINKQRSPTENYTNSYVYTLARVNDACYDVAFDIEDDDVTEADLHHLASHEMKTNSLRGIENHLIPEIYMQKKAEATMLHSKLFEIQNLMQVTDPELKADRLCHISEMYSRPAKFLAKALGTVDEIAAKYELTAIPLAYNKSWSLGYSDLVTVKFPSTALQAQRFGPILLV